jgi:UbiD family decarboxylase
VSDLARTPSTAPTTTQPDRLTDEPVLGLRAHVDHLEQIGELRHVRGVDWDLELGAVAELSYRSPGAPALLFDAITGYPEGQRVLTGSTNSSRRLGRTLRLGDDLDDRALVAALRGRPSTWEADAARFTARPVDRAPFLANHATGDDIDLLRFPVPRWHAQDGGRFIGTGCFVVTSDPETGSVNGGCYRMQVQDGGRSTTIAAVPGKHGAINIQKWFDREGRAPVTVSFGHDPLLLVLGGTEVPGGISELDYAGAVLGEQVPVVLGPATGLPIPAGAEIVVEGWLSPDRTAVEGPFGEWTGYYAGAARPAPDLLVENLWWRDDPIQLGAPPGKPPHDYSYMRTMFKSALIEDQLVSLGVPGITGAWAHEAGGGRLFVAVSVEQAYAGHARQVGHLAAQVPAAAYMNRYVVVVDHDIDVSSLDEVVWAISTRSDPGTDIEVLRRGWGSKLDPVLVPDSPPFNTRAVIDACIPWERRTSFPRVAESDPGYLDQVRRTWGHLLR